MSIDLVAVRDKVAEIATFNFVADWLSAADAIENSPPNPPAAFVTTSSERAGPNSLIGRHRQPVRQTVSVLFVLLAQRPDQPPTDEIETTRQAIVDKLVAWMPPGASTAFDYVSFSIRYSADGLIWCEILVAANYHLVATPS